MSTASTPSLEVRPGASLHKTERPAVNQPPSRSKPSNRIDVERPKEHGAYAMLGIPLVTAFLIAGFSWLAVAVSVAAMCGFLAHEPLMVATGRRGPRALRNSPNVYSRVVVRLAAATVLGTLAFVVGGALERAALAACFFTATVSFLLSAWGQQRSLTAQLWSSIGLTLPSLVVLLAGSVQPERALQLCGAWIVGQSFALVAVRSVIARQKKAAQGRVPLLNDTLQIALTLGAVTGLALGFDGLAYVAPLLVAGLGLRAFPPALKHLRRVGWSMVAANSASAIWMIVGERFLS